MKLIRARNAICISKHKNTTKFHKVRNKNMVSQQQSILAGLELMTDQSCKGRSRAVLSSFGSNQFGTNTATNYCKKQLDVAISDLIYSKGLPFNLTESHHIKRVL